MPASWQKITEDEDFQDMNMTERLYTRSVWFDTLVPELKAAGLSQDEITEVRLQELTNFDTGEGRVASFTKSAIQGIGSMFTSGMQGAGALTGLESVEQAGASGTKFLQNELVTNPQYEYTNAAGQAVGNVASLIGTAGGAGALAKGLGFAGNLANVQRGAALGSAFLAGSGEGASRADALGMEDGDKYARTLLGGAIEVGTEMIPFGLGTELSLLQRGVRSNIARGAATEGIEEGIAQVGGNVADIGLAPEGVKTPGVLEGVAPAVFGGAVAGGGLGGLSALSAPAIPSPTQTAAQTAQQSGMPEVAKVLEAVQQQARAQQATLPGSTLTEDEFNRLSPDRPMSPEEVEAAELAMDRRAAELSADLSPDRLRAAFDTLSPEPSPAITVPGILQTQTANEEDQRQREAQLLNEGVAPSEAIAPASPAVAAPIAQPETSVPGIPFENLEAEVSRRLGPDFIAQARTQEPSKAMSALRAAFPEVSEENLQAFAEEVVNRAAIETPVSTSDIAAGEFTPPAAERRFRNIDLPAARQRLQQGTTNPSQTSSSPVEAPPVKFLSGVQRDDGIAANVEVDGQPVRFFRPKKKGRKWEPWDETDDPVILQAAEGLNKLFSPKTPSKDVISQMQNILAEADVPRKVSEMDQTLADLFGEQYAAWPETERQAIREYARTGNEADLKSLPFAKRQAVIKARDGTIRFSKSVNPPQTPTGVVPADTVQSALTNFRKRIGAPLSQVTILSKSEAAEQFPDVAADPRFQNAEGFYVDGKVVIMPDGIGLRAGETPESAATRVILHETAGHLGLRDTLGKWSGEVENALKELQKSVPSLQGRTIAEVEEYFARAIENGGVPKTGILKKVWDAIVNAVRKIFGMEKIPNEEAVIRELLGRSLDSLRSGVAAGQSTDAQFSERVRSRGVPQHVDQEWLPVSRVSVEQNYDQANELLDQLSPDPFTGSREAISIVRSHLAGSPDNSTELGRQLQVNPQLPLATLHAVVIRMGDAAEIAAPGGKISNPWQWTEARTLTTQAMQLYQQQGQNPAQSLAFMRWHLSGLPNGSVPSFADYGPLLSIWGIQLENAKDRVTSRTGPGGIAAITGAGNTGTAVAQTDAAAAVENVGEEEDIKSIKKSLKDNKPTKAVKDRSQRIIDSLVPLPPKTKAEVLRIIEEQERNPTDDFVNRLTAIGVDPAAAMLLENQLRDLRVGARQADALAGYPRLKRLIEKMHAKPGGAPRWADIFRGIHGSSRDVERQLIIELQKNEAFASLPRDERLAVAEDLRNLFNELRRKEAEKAIKALNNRGKTEEDRKKVDSAIPALMQLLELGGVLTEDSVAKAIGEKFGIRTMTPAEEAHALSMWKEIRGLKGVVRRRKVREMIDYIARTAHFTTAEIVHDWTMRSILANGSTLMSILNGGLAEAMSMAFTVPVGRAVALMKRGEWAAAGRVVAQMPRNLIHLLNGFAAGAYVMGTGDTSILTNYTDSAQSLLQEGTTPGARNRNQDIHFLDAYWRNMRKNTKWLSSGFAKKAGATWMDLAGRMIQSADVVARIIVQEIALDTQLAQQDPDLLQAIRNPSKADRETAYRKAIADIYGSGSVPSRFIAMNNPAVKARMTEILGYDAAGTDERRTGLERSYVLAEDIAKAANLQKNPQGIARYIYRGGVSLGGIAENALTDLANRLRARGESAPPVLTNLLNFLAFVSHYTGKSASLIFGTKFMRAVVGLGTQAIRFVPGSAAVRSAMQRIAPETFDGRNELLDGHWYMLNLVGATIGAALVKFADKDDDDEGWHVEGSWGWYNFDQQKERKAAGLEPLTVWRRLPDGKIEKLGYSQMPFRVLLAAVGGQKDNKIAQPTKYDPGLLDKYMPSLSISGLSAVKDVAALDTFQRLISASPFSTPEERELGIVTRLGQSAMQTVTGVFPRFIKDIDQGLDPNRYTERSLWGNFVRGVPFARGAANEGRPDVTILGRPVDVSSAPWRRFYKPFVPRDESEKVLFDLIAKGVKIPSWSDVSKGAYMVLDEDNVPQKVPDDLAYQISVEQGQALADILTNYDLSGDPETVSRQLSDITENAWRNVRRQHRVIHGRQ